MSSTDVAGDPATGRPPVPGEVRLEVVTVPVSDVDRAKSFYEGLGWRLDADLAIGDDIRAVQFTPPGSHCSVAFGRGLTTAEPGSSQRFELAVSNVEVAREDLIADGADVGEVFHLEGGNPVPGPDPDRRPYLSYASFSDPDGNGWLLQEITARMPGR